MAGSVHGALIAVRGTLSSWACCPVNSVLDSSNTAGTAPREDHRDRRSCSARVGR